MSIPFSVDLRLILLSQLAFLLCQFKQPLAHAPVLPPSSYFYTAEYLNWAIIKILKKEAHFKVISNLRKFCIKIIEFFGRGLVVWDFCILIDTLFERRSK
jgi:hypothetical protein